ncbi:MAG: hypothetical protein ACI9DC_001942 [Gammaproteobacteria bacterium]|jgi:hypothetical protein
MKVVIQFCRVLMCRAALAVLSFCVVPVTSASERLDLLLPGSLDGWTARSFAGNTSYEAVVVEGVHAIRARADASASGLYWENAVDLEQWPVLRWRWRVGEVLPPTDERAKAGDDYVARLYVVASHPLFFWKTRAVCYVWSSAGSPGEDWPNPYTGHVHMVVLNGKGDAPGQWAMHERDVAADFERFFGDAPQRIDAVALMTDTDQSGAQATAWYADLRFESR